MSNINPAFPIPAPLAEAVGWAVDGTVQGGRVGMVLRDDGITMLACYLDRAGYTRAKLITALLASTGATAGELARINAMSAATNW